MQRRPVGEKRGRIHSSTAVVTAVTEATRPSVPPAEDGDEFRITWFSGTGKGGQHRNKHRNCCRVTHLPTGMTEVRQSRSRDANLKSALAALRAQLARQAEASERRRTEAVRQIQAGSGMRGDKIVTLRFMTDQAIHHLTGRRMSARRWMAGHQDELWP